MKKERPLRLHKFTDRHPLLCALLWIAAGYLFIQLFVVVIGVPFGILSGLPFSGSSPVDAAHTDSSFAFALYCASVPASLLVLAAFRRWYRGEFFGTLGKRGLWKTTACLCGIIVYWAVGIVPILLQGGSLHMPAATSIAVSLSAGVSEETLFRALPICILARRWKDEEKKYPLIVLFSAASFGLVHATNALMGANPASTALQVVETACIGFFFGAVYLRGGNLWPLMAAHVLNDVLAFAAASDADLSQTGVILSGASWDSAFDLALCAALVVIGVLLIRKKKHPEIAAAWSETWRFPAALHDIDANNRESEFAGTVQTENNTNEENAE